MSIIISFSALMTLRHTPSKIVANPRAAGLSCLSRSHIKPTFLLRRGFASVLTEKPCNRTSRHDGNTNPGAHEAHHGRELGHRRNMVERVSRSRGGSVDNSSSPRFVG